MCQKIKFIIIISKQTIKNGNRGAQIGRYRQKWLYI